jgi:surface protein
MSVIGGPNNPISNGLIYALDFKNNRSYVSGSTSAKSLLFNPTTASISAGFDTATNTLIFSGSQNGTTNLTFPQINYDKSFTISYVANIKSGGLGFGGNYTGSNTILHTYFDSGSVRLGFFGAVTGFTGSYYTRTYPTSGNNQYSWVYTTGSLTLFVNGVPVSSSAANEGSVPYSGSDFKLSGRASDNFWSGSLGNVFIYNRALTNDEIRANYTLASREYGLPTPPSFSIDENAYLFSQTAGITSSAYITALDTFVRGLKSASLWDKMVGIYPFLGGNNTLNQLNLKESSLTVYPASFTGSWSSSFSGSKSNTTASYATLTGLTPSTYHPLVSSQSIHLSYLSYDTPVSGGYLMGVEQIPGLPGDIATPAAAYSVRKVRTAYTGSALRVRRDSDDLSFDVGFDGSGNLDTGSLLTRMTASITTTLPGNYSGLAAAYSLRKVSSSYSGYAIEVRRAVDNYSASIGFDGSGNLNTASLASFIRTGSETPISSYSGLAVAYSLRKVVPTYGGSAIEIQSGSVSQSIGFDSFGDLDVAAIKSFAGSGDAFVKTWYDQSGNGYHASQGTLAAQPKIYSGSLGAIITQGGKPAVSFASSTILNINGILSSSAYNDFWVLQTEDTVFIPMVSVSGNRFSWIGAQGSTSGYLYEQFGTPTLYKNSTLSTPTNQGQIYDRFLGYNLIHTAGANTSTWSSGWSISGYSEPYRLVANIQEILIYTASVSTNRTYIENNINSYYGIYTPTSVSTENAFVKTWYDQSGNNRHATQSVDALQPQIVSSGVIVTQNGKPTIDHTSTTILELASDLNLGKVHSLFGAVKFDTYGTELFGKDGGGSGFTYGIYQDATNNYYAANGVFGSSNGVFGLNFSLLAIQRDNTAVNQYKNSSILGSTITLGGNNDFLLRSLSGEQNTAYNLDGKLSEVLIYSGSITSSRTHIEDNINGYYNIFTQSLASGSGYVTTWYDQSGNNRHVSQSVAANQPLILSSGSILMQSGKPILNFTGKSLLTNVGTYSQPTTYFITEFTPPSVTTIVFGSENSSARHQIYQGLNVGYTVRMFAGNDIISPVSMSAYRVGTYLFNTSNSTGFINGELRISGNVGSYTQQGIKIGDNTFGSSSIQEVIQYTSSQANNRQPIEQNINNYFNIYSQPYNQNSNSLSLFSSPTLVAGAANAAPTQLITGGPEGLITVSRTGSGDYTLWKNRVPTKTSLPASVPQSQSIYLNAANVSNALFSASQNTVAYASVGAGLTDSEVYTYYELVDNLQTNLGRSKSTNPNAFITTWDTRISGTGTVTGTSSIALPLYGTQAITASWGDGTVSLISQSAQADRTHSYATPGVYTVSITGTGQGFQFNGDGDRLKLMDIGQWGSISGSGARVFNGCSNLVGTAADRHIIEWTDQLWYFLNCTKFNGAIGNWDMSKVTGLNSMFDNARSFNQPLNSWDVSKVTSMQGTFQSALAFNQDIGSWNMSNVTSISGYFGWIFYNAQAFNNGGSPSINNWNTSKITNMDYVFYNALSFNQPIGGWNVANSTDFSYMFLNAVSFNNGNSTNINNWIFNTSSTFAMTSMFQGASVFNQPIGNWNVSKSINMSSMFTNATSFNQNIGSWNVSNVANMSGMFNTATSFNQNIGAWNIGSATNTSGMFTNAFSFNNSGSSTINNWNTSKVTNMSGMFSSARLFNQPIGNWNVSSSTNMNQMFYSASSFNQDIGSWNISSSTNISQMFEIARDFNQNIGSWDTDNVTTMYRTFRLATSFNNGGFSDINNWNTSKVTNMSEMFNDAVAFNQPIGNWDVSKVTNMEGMFRNATAFNQDIGSWNVGSVTSFDGYFGGFMQGKSAANYSYLHTIYDGWINNKLQPAIKYGGTTISFGSIKYSGSAAQGRALLTRAYNTGSVSSYSLDGPNVAITCSFNHNVVAGNKIFISGSSEPTINGVQTIFATSSATMLTLNLAAPLPSVTGDTLFTGYGWSITDGGVV